MKILCTNDWHFAVKNPASRTDDYNEELFDLLSQILQLIKHFNPAALCVAGDIFHDRNRAPWAVFIRLLGLADYVTRHFCPIVAIPGNHDLTHDRFESRLETPYGALVSSGLFTDVSRRAYKLNGNRAPVVYGVPWPDGEQPDAFANIPKDVDVVLAHGFADELGEPIYGDHCHKYDDLARQAPWVKVWHFGHDHSDHGVYTLKTGAKVINIGALSRGALNTDNLTRQVKVAVVDFPETGGPVTVQQIALRVKPAPEIFDLQLRQRKVEEAKQVEQFVQQLRAGLTGFDVDFTTQLASTPLPAAVRAKVDEYIRRAESTV